MGGKVKLTLNLSFLFFIFIIPKFKSLFIIEIHQSISNNLFFVKPVNLVHWKAEGAATNYRVPKIAPKRHATGVRRLKPSFVIWKSPTKLPARTDTASGTCARLWISGFIPVNAVQFGQILGFFCFLRLFLPSSRYVFILCDPCLSAGNSVVC